MQIPSEVLLAQCYQQSPFLIRLDAKLAANRCIIPFDKFLAVKMVPGLKYFGEDGGSF